MKADLAQMGRECLQEVAMFRSQLNLVLHHVSAVELRVTELCEVICESDQSGPLCAVAPSGSLHGNHATFLGQFEQTALESPMPPLPTVETILESSEVAREDVAQVRFDTDALQLDEAESSAANEEPQFALTDVPFEPPGLESTTSGFSVACDAHQIDADQVEDLGPGGSDCTLCKRSADIIEHQLAFTECFGYEIFNQRPLLLSQMNNLYKMRGGKNLPYKELGYEKLRNFLLDVPGLSVIGRGNRMQVHLTDKAQLESFRSIWPRCQVERASGATPQFRMPKPIPDLVLCRLYTVFLKSERNEVPLRNFCKAWSRIHPGELLNYRSLGFRDVRGLLSQVPFVEKVGSKNAAKYVLRPDFPGPLPGPIVDENSEMVETEGPFLCSIPGPIVDENSEMVETEGPFLCSIPGDVAVPRCHSARRLDPSPVGIPTARSVKAERECILPGFIPGDLAVPHQPAKRGSPKGFTVACKSVCGQSKPTAGVGHVGTERNESFFHFPCSPSAAVCNTSLDSCTQSAVIEPVVSQGQLSTNKFAEDLVTKSKNENGPIPDCSDGLYQVQTEAATESVEGSSPRSVKSWRRERSPKKQSLYFTSPAAFSSDTRDATVQQGKFDMCNVLKIQMLKDKPGMVCDISSGQVMATNNECDMLFETGNDQEMPMTQRDVFSLIHEDDRHAFSTCLAYTMLSEKANMQPEHLRIVALTGRVKQVCVEGAQLVGMWWQLLFTGLKEKSTESEEPSLGSELSHDDPASNVLHVRF